MNILKRTGHAKKTLFFFFNKEEQRKKPREYQQTVS